MGLAAPIRYTLMGPLSVFPFTSTCNFRSCALCANSVVSLVLVLVDFVSIL
jgi:hypothetical protein